MKNFNIPLYLALASGTLFSTSQAFGVLPPLYTSLNQYKVLLTSPEITEKLNSGEWIEDVRLHDTTFIITTSKHTLQVDVEYDQQPMPGPARFRLMFHDAIPRTQMEQIEQMKEQPVDIQPEVIQH